MSTAFLKAVVGLALTVAAVAGLACSEARAARRTTLNLRHVVLDLPGPPSKVLPADLDGDGRTDLVVVVAYTEIDEIGESRVENMVEITTVIPAVFDRREIRVFLAEDDGGYRAAGRPLPLPPSVLHLEAAAPGPGPIALTDGGLSRLILDATGDGPVLRFEALIDDPPFLAGTGSFYAALEIVHDLDGDGATDVLLPSSRGLSVYIWDGTALSAEPRQRIVLPRAPRRSFVRSGWSAPAQVRESYALPAVRDVNGDALPDLVFRRNYRADHPAPLHVLPGTGGGRFGTLRDLPLDCHDVLTDVRLEAGDAETFPWPHRLTAFRDLDGDGRAEAVIGIEQSRGDGLRKGLKDAKRPIHEYRFHRVDDALAVVAQPYSVARLEGHTVEEEVQPEDSPFRVERFQDLDADGREELITFTLDFSIFQALKVLATKRIGVGVDFHVHVQNAEGHFERVPGLDLSEKLKLDLNALEIGRFAQFAGDFDGDGLREFVHLGRGSKVTIHRGRPGCRYAEHPDLVVELESEPDSLDLVRIEDLDGDGRSDLRITRPLPISDEDATAPARLDLYLSGDGR